jgi:hypothetical protein
VTPFVTAGAGFLVAVLWFDLMHDVQALGHRRDRPLPEDVLASVARYYRRVTTDARPMNRLVALAMVGTLVALGVQLGDADVPDWAVWASLALAAGPIALAGLHTVPSAVRLGRRTDSADSADSADEQSRVARSILRDHLCCLVSITTLLIVQLGFAR